MYLENAAMEQKERLDDGWLFHWGESTLEDIQKAPADTMEPVTLPHDWSVHFPFDASADTLGAGGYARAGKGWYKKVFTVPESAAGQQVMLQFDGVYMNSKVWLNGKLLGGHIYGYTPFSFPIGEYLKPCGDNELIVFVDNSAQPNSRWYSGSGITRPVWIYRENVVHISREDLFIYTKAADDENNTATVEFTGTVAADRHLLTDNLFITWQIEDPNGRVCSSGQCHPKFFSIENDGDSNGEDSNDGDGKGGNSNGRAANETSALAVTPQAAAFKVTVPLTAAVLWSPDKPKLYKLILKLYKTNATNDTSNTIDINHTNHTYDINNATLLDLKTQSFGLRTADFDSARGFLLNGRQVKLNGVCLHHDGGCVGAAVPLKIWERRLEKLKAMGCNSIRFTHNPPDPALLSMCDRMGFLVMAEAFDEWKITKQKEWGSNTHESLGYSKWFDQCGEQDLRTMVLRDRNHPCIILWSIGNEVPEQLTEEGWKVARRLKEIVYSLDPTRKITQANDQIAAEPVPAMEAFLNILDVVGYNYTDRWRQRAEGLYDEDRYAHPQWCVIGTENSSAGYIRNDARLDGDPWRAPYYSVPVRIGHLLRYTMTHDFVAGDYMWTGVDYLGEASWPNRSQTCGVLDTCGFEKDGYYFYKSIWKREEPMVYMCPHWNLDFPEGKIVPVICYTSCHSAELFLNGKSYGRKSYLYPAYGMSESFGHWTKRKEFPNTDDLFLSWDVPYIPGTLTVIGYDENGVEMARMERHTADRAHGLVLHAHESTVTMDGDSVIQLDIDVTDHLGRPVPEGAVPVQLQFDDHVRLMGTDNGRPDSHSLFLNSTIETFKGKAFAVFKPLKPGRTVIIAGGPELMEASVEINIIENNEKIGE